MTDNDQRNFVIRVVLKAAVLFLIFNVMFAALPMSLLGRMSLYNNVLIPGRHRFPFGENPASYNLSLFQIDAMFASHEVSTLKAENEYRVFVIGDSSVWGTLLTPEQTLAAYLNTGNYQVNDGQQVKVYNLGYPTIDTSKDLLLLSYAVQYDPDLIIWLTTLEALPVSKQLSSPIVQYNPDPMRDLITRYDLPLDPASEDFVDRSFWQQTIIGERRTLSDLIRLQMFGVMWASTGIDQFYPDEYEPRAEDLAPDDDFYDLPASLQPDDLALYHFIAGIDMAGDVPVVLINEPMFISQGENSDIRYNFYYPIWAYDDYRRILSTFADEYDIPYLDLWDAIPATEYTNSAIHLTPEGSSQLAGLIAEWLGWVSSP